MRFTYQLYINHDIGNAGKKEQRQGSVSTGQAHEVGGLNAGFLENE